MVRHVPPVNRPHVQISRRVTVQSRHAFEDSCRTAALAFSDLRAHRREHASEDFGDARRLELRLGVYYLWRSSCPLHVRSHRR